jgi:beta-fructofuranosidase
MNKMRSLFLTTLLSILLASCGTPIISDKPFDQGLLAHFKFDENNQSLLKDSTKNLSDTQMFYHLHTSKTSPRKEVQFKDGVDGQAMVFDGYSTYGQINQSEIKVSGYEFSIGSWVAPRAYNYAPQNLKDDRLQALASQYYKDDSLSMGFTLGYKREGKFSFGVGTNHGWFQLWDEGSPLKQYEWNHIFATFNGNKGEMSLYLNGRIVNRLEIPVGTYIEPCDEPLTIGKNTITSSSGDSLMGIVSGLMDDLRLYSRVVPFKEYQSYYQSLLVDGKIKPLDFNDVWLQNTLTDDAYKPQYHGGPYEHWMNEPHAPFYYKGLYHLFYQANPNGPYFNDAQGIAWGHLTSPDMVNWTPRKEVIVPQAGTVAPDGIWSGGSILDKDGNPVLFFTAGDYAHPGIISNQNIGLAYPKDLNDPYLTEWIVADQLAIEQKPGQGRTGEFRDAHVIKEGDDYYLLVGSGDENSSRGTVVVYHTNVTKHNYFFNWDYKGHLFDYPSNDAKYGTVWELPVLLPLKDENGNPSNKYMLAISPAPATTADNNIIYWTGTFDKESVRFIPDFTHPRRMDYGRNVFTGPSGFVDPLSGDSMLFSILQSQREAVDLAQSGWTHNVGLTRELFYDSNRQDLGIRILDSVIDNLATGVIIDAADIDVETLNGQLNQFKSDMYALEIKLSNLTNRFEIRTRKSQNGEEYTSVYVDPIEQLIGVNTMMNQNNARLTSGDFNGVVTGLDEVTLTLFVDRSQIEVVVNDQKTISSRSYPKDLAANGLSLHFAGGGTIEQIVIYQLASIYQ